MKTAVVLTTLSLLTLGACSTDNRQNTGNDNSRVNTQQDTPVKLIEYLIGEWQVQSSDGGNGPGERITFTAEARYIVHKGGQKVDSGAYRMNEQLNNLYLESEANEEPREFELQLESETMRLTPRETNAQQSAGGGFVYRRIGPASVPPDKSAPGDETQKTEPQ